MNRVERAYTTAIAGIIRASAQGQACREMRLSAIPPSSASPDVAGTSVCAICQCPIERQEARAACPECAAPYHADCWQDNGGCAVYGCSQVPPTEKLADVEIPVAYWGQENKPCPVCANTILAVALRCRYCGTTFETARPQDSAEFSQGAARKMREPSLRKGAVWVLILGLIPFTAPFAAIFGGIWYYKNKSALAQMPVVSAH